ncbi:MAG: deoxyribonuclease V [Alphaproteobacteria bacterium]|nr:deoxyribonuclease V [Alphaproteobacteria bacterium]
MQDALRAKQRLENDFGHLWLIAGVDVAYDVVRNLAWASIVTMQPGVLRPAEQVMAYAPADFPYIPGLLSFREIPAILEAMKKLTFLPSLLMVDGQGIAHPRRMGIAAHLGVLLNLPSIGVAKSRLTGNHEEPGPNKGDYAPLIAGSQRIGTVLRSKENTHPLYVSPGHRVDMETATALTLQCLTRYRLPEPTRFADKLSKTRGEGMLLL